MTWEARGDCGRTPKSCLESGAWKFPDDFCFGCEIYREITEPEEDYDESQEYTGERAQ